MVHRLSSLNSCFEANQCWYVFNLSFHYETVSLPRSLQVRKLCLPTQEIPLQQLPQKGNFPQKWAQLMPLSRAVWRGSGMRALQTPLLTAASTGICSSALAERAPLHPAPLSPGTARTLLRVQSTDFLLEKKISWDKHRTHRAPKEQRKRRGNCRKALQTVLISHLKIREKILPPLLDLFWRYVGHCTLSLTCSTGSI